MANNLDDLMVKILARILIHQRKRVVLPILVNRDFAVEMRRKGSTVDVKVPARLAPYDITPGATRTVGNDDTTPSTVPIKLDMHRGNGFRLTDKEITQIDAEADFIPMETVEASNGLIDDMNEDVASSYTSIYGFAGTSGQTPFQRATNPSADYEDSFIHSAAGGVLNEQKCPVDPRHMVMNIAAHTNAQRLDAFRHAEKLGDKRVAQRAQLGMLGGFENWWQHYIPTHTAGTLTGSPTASSALKGAKTFTINTGASAAVALNLGDIITFAGHTQTYVVTDTAGVTVGASSSGSVNIEPGLEVALAGAEVVSVKATHVVNLAFNPFAFAFVMRRPEDFRVSGMPTGPSQTLQDPVTGIVMRLEILREHKQWYFELDALWGSGCPIPWLATRIAG